MNRKEEYTNLIRAEAKARYWLRKDQSYESKNALVLAKISKAQFEGELLRKLDAADELQEAVMQAIAYLAIEVAFPGDDEECESQLRHVMSMLSPASTAYEESN